MPLDACSHRSARSPGAAPGALLRTVVSVALVGSASCFHVTSGRISRCTQSQIIHAARTLNVQAREGERQITNQPCRVLFKQVEVPAEHGETLRTALLKSGKVTPHNGKAQIINCRGLGTCGTCAVEIKGKVSPSTWNAKERLRLNFPPHSMPGNQKLRLACQVCEFVCPAHHVHLCANIDMCSVLGRSSLRETLQ